MPIGAGAARALSSANTAEEAAVAKWTQHQATLQRDHGWRAKDGNVVFVADRGAVHSGIPRHWVIELNGGTPASYDRKPPYDECRLQLTVIRLPPRVDSSQLPPAPMLEEVLANPDDDPDHDPTAQRSEITTQNKCGIESAWTKTTFIDTTEHRPVRSHTLIARGNDVQIPITFDSWADDATRVLPVWKDVPRSLRLGEYIADPRRGPQRQSWVDRGIGLPRRPRK
jgi:hypothetical protein